MVDKIYKKSVNNIKSQLLYELAKVEELSNNKPEWTSPRPITEPSPKSNGFSVSKSIGVYRIIHKPTNKIASIGCGKVGNRKYRHKGVYLNDGKTMISENGAPSGSMTGMHMYKHDKNINNWLFQWAYVGNKSLAEQYEILLQKTENPLFNSLHMAGK